MRRPFRPMVRAAAWAGAGSRRARLTTAKTTPERAWPGERHGRPGSSRAGALGDRGPVPDRGGGRLDRTGGPQVHPVPGWRAAAGGQLVQVTGDRRDGLRELEAVSGPEGPDRRAPRDNLIDSDSEASFPPSWPGQPSGTTVSNGLHLPGRRSQRRSCSRPLLDHRGRQPLPADPQVSSIARSISTYDSPAFRSRSTRGISRAVCRWYTSYRPRAPGCMIGARPMLWRLTRGHSRSRSSAEATEARAENLFRPIWTPTPG